MLLIELSQLALVALYRLPIVDLERILHLLKLITHHIEQLFLCCSEPRADQFDLQVPVLDFILPAFQLSQSLFQLLQQYWLGLFLSNFK